jgi:hypothetical protein
VSDKRFDSFDQKTTSSIEPAWVSATDVCAGYQHASSACIHRMYTTHVLCLAYKSCWWRIRLSADCQRSSFTRVSSACCLCSEWIPANVQISYLRGCLAPGQTLLRHMQHRHKTVKWVWPSKRPPLAVARHSLAWQSVAGVQTAPYTSVKIRSLETFFLVQT